MPRAGAGKLEVPTGGGPEPGIPDRFVPAIPTTPEELQATWGVPTDWFDRTTVKTTRLIRGTDRWPLLDSCPLALWSLEMIALRFGPGVYRILCGNGPSARKNATIEVEPAFAENAGWAAPPPPSEQVTPYQMQAAQTFQRAQQGPVQPLELAAMIQTAVDTAIARTQRQDSGLDSFMKGFSTANELGIKAMEQAKAMLGLNPVQAEPRETGWAEVALQIVPSILETLRSLASQPAQPAPSAQIQAAPNTPTLHHPHQEVQQVRQDSMTIPVPPEETRPILNLLKGFAENIKPHLAGPETAKDLATQLSGLVGVDLDPSVVATANYIQGNGPAILGNIDQVFVSEKAAMVIIEWANIIRAQEEGGQ